mmetsp:Transcript_8689/g.14425  ORF Transcript_8689/g.14425 Transcript_8689/m.14425 type:complete len:486 (+) Transcript_8689:87-1544(+)
MGIESSSQKNGGASLFLDPELSSAYEQLQTDRTMAYEFIAFFKSGEWLEDVAEYEPTGIRTMTHEERLAKEKKSPLYEYKPEHGKLRKFDELFVGNKSLRLSRRSSLSGISRSISQQRRIFYGDVEGSFAAHVDVAKCCYFEPGHLRAIMLHLALSHFLNSPLYSKYRVAPCSSSSICDESTWAESSYFSVSSRGSNTPSCRPSRPASAKQVPEPADNSIPKLLTTSAWHLQNSLIESGLLLDDAEILLETLQITPAAGTGTATVMPDLQQQAQQKSILHSAESLLYEALDQHPLGITICEIVDEGTAVDENATSSSSSFIGKDTNTAAAAVAEATSISSGSKPRCPVIIYANAAYARTTGYSRKELIGKPFSFIQGAHTDIDQLQNVRTAMCTGQRHKAALTCHGKYGREFLDLIAMRPLYINPVHRVSRQRTSTSTGGGGTSSTSTKSVLDPPPPAAAAVMVVIVVLVVPGWKEVGVLIDVDS